LAPSHQAGMSREPPAVGGKEDGRRHPHNAIGADDIRVGCRPRHVGNAKLSKEPKPVLVGAQLHERTHIEPYDEDPLSIRLMQILEVRHLCSTRRAQTRPEIEHDRLTLTDERGEAPPSRAQPFGSLRKLDLEVERGIKARRGVNGWSWRDNAAGGKQQQAHDGAQKDCIFRLPSRRSRLTPPRPAAATPVNRYTRPSLVSFHPCITQPSHEVSTIDERLAAQRVRNAVRLLQEIALVGPPCYASFSV